VKRAFLSLSLAPLAALAGAACNGKITRVECTEMLDRYIEMTVSGDPDLAELPPNEARAARETKKARSLGDPRFVRAQEQCETEVSRREYRCAMKAPTPETWQACID
jgi:hypothetical protein